MEAPRSRLFHAIVILGAAVGSACGGATTAGDPRVPDASGDGPPHDGAFADEVLPDAPEAGRDAATDGVVIGLAEDAASEAAGVGDAADAGDPCAPPRCDADGGPTPNCCVGRGCFPCFV